MLIISSELMCMQAAKALVLVFMYIHASSQGSDEFALLCRPTEPIFVMAEIQKSTVRS